MRNRMKKFIKIINCVLIAATMAVLIFEAHLLTKAQDAEPVADIGITTAGDIRLDEGSKCARRMKEVLFLKKEEFGKFMNEHFRSSKPTSELIPGAVELFRRYRKEMFEEMKKFLPLDKTEGTAALTERPSCEKAVEEDFVLMKQMITQHIIENAYAKKSTRLLDRYKEINSKLRKLNFTIAQMYGYFSAFSQKLPCYATKCVQR